MIVKFFSGGGNAKSSADYLIGKNHDREKAKEIRGDIRLTQSIAEQTNYNQQITVGCLSFEEKNIPEDQKEKLMDRFEETFLAGLEKENYSIAWIEHTDKDRLELNFYIANVELESNKRLFPYFHKADLPLKDNFQKVINYEYKLTNPDDPQKTQLIRQDKSLDKSAKEIQDIFHNHFLKEIDKGNITERNQITDQIKNAGYEISRETDKSISIKNPSGGRNIRLKGAIYEKQFFSGELAEKITASKRESRTTISGISEEDYKRSIEHLQRGIEQRINKHQEKYKKRDSQYFAGIKRDRGDTIELEESNRFEHAPMGKRNQSNSKGDQKLNTKEDQEYFNFEISRNRSTSVNNSHITSNDNDSKLQDKGRFKETESSVITITSYRKELSEQKDRLAERRKRIEQNKLSDQRRKDSIERYQSRNSGYSGVGEGDSYRNETRHRNTESIIQEQASITDNDQIQKLIEEHYDLSRRIEKDTRKLQRESPLSGREEQELESRNRSNQSTTGNIKQVFNNIRERAKNFILKFRRTERIIDESKQRIAESEQQVDSVNAKIDRRKSEFNERKSIALRERERVPPSIIEDTKAFEKIEETKQAEVQKNNVKEKDIEWDLER